MPSVSSSMRVGEPVAVDGDDGAVGCRDLGPLGEPALLLDVLVELAARMPQGDVGLVLFLQELRLAENLQSDRELVLVEPGNIVGGHNLHSPVPSQLA